MINKKFKLHPALVFLILTIIIMIISSIGGILNLETNYYSVNSKSGDLETNVVTINNLFNRTGIQYLISNMVKNFLEFAPLGNLIVGLLGVGVAYKSGFLNSLFKFVTSNVSRKLITFMVVLLGVITSMFLEVGYVILIPLAAILFLNLGRHPSAGICAAFAGITFGYGANICINGYDAILYNFGNNATKILDTSYNYNIYGNIFLMIVGTILISYFGMLVTEKFIIPRLGKYISDENDPDREYIITQKEKKGVIIALLSILLLSLILIYCIISGLPFSGLLLNLKETMYVNQLFGDGSYFRQGAVFIFSSLLMICGLIYGLRVGTIKNNRDLVDGMNYYLKGFSSIIVLIFFAAQFCLIFKETNIGIFIVASLTELLNNLELTGILLIVVCFLIILLSSFFVPASSTKWAIISPIMIPLFMQSSLTPEFATAVYRAADSSLKGITPLFTYFVILIGFLQIYNKKSENIVTISEAMKLMIPYTIILSIVWFVLIIAFYILGIPIGYNVGVML